MVIIAGSGICPTYYQPITYPEYSKTRVILYLGRIQYDKGLQCLIASLKRLKNENIQLGCNLITLDYASINITTDYNTYSTIYNYLTSNYSDILSINLF